MGLIKDALVAYQDRTIQVKALREYLAGSLKPWDIISGQGHRPDYDPSKLVEKYKGWAYPCAMKNASAIAGASLRLYATRATGENRARRQARSLTKGETAQLRKRVYQSPRIKAAQELEEIESHPLLDLLQNVNPENNQSDLMEQLSTFQDLTGSAYWYIVPGPLGIPGEIWTLPSQWVRVVPGKEEFIAGYLYGRDISKAVKMEPQEVIWFRFPNPCDPWAGRGVIESAYWAIVGYESMEKFETNQTENHGIKDLLIKYKKGGLTEKQRRDLQRSWGNALAMASKDKSPLIADEDFDIESASWSPKELAFLQGRQWRKEEIIAAFGQHPAMYDKNANTANIEGAIYLWEEYGITPRLKKIEQRLNEKLVPMYNEPRLFLAFDPVVESNRDADRADYQLLLSNGYPINRVLADMQRDPVEGGDTGFIGAMSVPLADAGFYSEPGPGTIPNDDQPPAVRSRQKRVRVGGTEPTPVICHTVTKADDGTVNVDRTGRPNPRLSKREIEVAGGLRQVWEAQTILAIREASKASAADFSWCASDEWAQEIYDLTHGAIREEIAIGGLRGARTIGIQMTDFLDRQRVQQYIRAHTFQFANKIGATTEDKLKLLLEDSMKRGLSIAETQKRIEETFAGWGKVRAERVARYETSRAKTFGTETQWRETGVVTEKVWKASSDACPFCLAMNGKTMSLGEAFVAKGEAQTVRWNDQDLVMRHDYEDSIGGDLHPNCRCVILPRLITTD